MRKSKCSVNGPAQGNFADEEIAHDSANQVPSLSDINIRSKNTAMLSKVLPTARRTLIQL